MPILTFAAGIYGVTQVMNPWGKGWFDPSLKWRCNQMTEVLEHFPQHKSPCGGDPSSHTCGRNLHTSWGK